MYNIKRIAALAIALILVLGCFNVPRQMEAWASTTTDDSTESPDPTPTPAPKTVTLYADPTSLVFESGNGKFMNVDIKAREAITNITSFTITVPYNPEIFSSYTNNISLGSFLQGKGTSGTKSGGGVQGYITCPFIATAPFTIPADTTLFSIQLDSRANKAYNNVKLTVNGSSSGTHSSRISYMDDSSDPAVEREAILANQETPITILGTVTPIIELTTSTQSPYVGSVITAICRFAENDIELKDATITYQWYRRNGSVYTYYGTASAAATSYTTVVADLGCIVGVRVTVSGSGFSGSGTCELDQVILKKPAPAKPGETSIIVTGVGDTWITLEPFNEFEFALTLVPDSQGQNPLQPPVGTVWQKMNTFTKLTPETSYYIWSRYAGTADTLPGEAYLYENIVTTTPTAHEIELKTSGDNVNDPSAVYYSVLGGGKPVKGATIFLYAEPANGYYFDHWEVSYPGTKVEVLPQVTGVNLAREAYFVMPQTDDKTVVTVVAYFKPKATPTLTLRDRQMTYGSTNQIADPVEFFNILLVGGDGDASDKDSQFKEYLRKNIKLYYRLAGTQNPLQEFPDYTKEENKNFQIDAGKYQLVAEYAGDVKNMPARNEQMIFEVLKAPGQAPNKPKIGVITANSIQILDPELDCKYVIDDGRGIIPQTDSSRWEYVTGGDKVFGGLFASTTYMIAAFRPGSDNYTESAVSYTVVSTLHTWKASVREDTEGGKQVTSVYFFIEDEPTATPVPELKNIYIRNDASGTFADVDIEMLGLSKPDGASDDPDDWFELSNTQLSGAKVASGNSTFFTITPKTGLLRGIYRAQITINATQAEDESRETKPTYPGEKDAVILGLPYVFEVVLEVTEYPPIAINGLGDQFRTYNQNEQAVDTTKISVAGGSLDKEDIVYTYKGIWPTVYDGGTDGTTPPTNAGTYLVTAEPKVFTQDEINNNGKQQFSGRATAVMTISPKVLVISGLTAESRLYDGTVNATLTGGVLEGAFENDDVYIKRDSAMSYNANGIPAVGVFDTKHHGWDKPVYVGTGKDYKMTLEGIDSANYQLTQPNLVSTILQKPIVPIFGAVEKIYDGTINIASVPATFRDGDVCPGDNLTVEFTNCKTETRNVGRDIAIVMGTMGVTGNGDKNYIISTPTLPTATIKPKGVFVTISGKSEVDYDGTPKSLTGTYETCADDAPNVEVTYNGVGVAPWLAGNYTIGAIVRDPNYEIIGDILGIREMTIRAGKLYYTDITRSVIPGDTSLKTIPLTAFNVTDSQGYAGIAGEYSIGTVIDQDGILADGYPKIEGSVVSFRIKNSANLNSEYAQIQIKFVPLSGTFEQLGMNLQVMMAPEGYTNSIINAPNTVNIGDSIDYTNIRLRTVFDSDGHIEDAVITDAMISSGYDKTDLRPSNLGLRNVVVSYPGNPLRTASFNIRVVDVIEAFTIRAPDKLTYHWLIDQTLDLTGGLLMPTMRTGSAADTVPLEAGMLSVSNSTLLKIGSYPVSVTYQKKIKNAAFTINVIEPAPINAQDPPTGADPGVLDVDPNTTFTDSAGKVVNFSNVQLVITPLAYADEAKLRAAIEEDNFFRRLPTDSIQVLDISLKDKTTGLDVEPNKPVTFRINYPSGTDRSTTLRVLHVPRNDDEWQVYPPTRREEGLEVTVQSFSPFAIGWMAGAYLEPEDPNPSGSPSPSPSPGGTPSPVPVVTVTVTPENTASASPSPSPTPGVFAYDSMTESEVAFWEAVLDMVKSAQKGSVIRVNAKSYDKMPVEVMEAMVNSSDATLVISWNNGEDIVITSKTAFRPESTREYFPLSLLADLYGTEPPKTDDPDEGEEWLNSGQNSSSSSSSSSGSGSSANQPTVADSSRFREAMQDYIAQAVMNSNGNVYDIDAPDDPEHDLKPVTPQTAGWLTSDGETSLEDAILRPSIEKPTLSSPGIGALLIIIGVMLALAGAATGLYIFVSRKNANEE